MSRQSCDPATPILRLVSDNDSYEIYADGSRYISCEGGGVRLVSPCGRYQIAPTDPAEIVDIGRGHTGRQNDESVMIREEAAFVAAIRKARSVQAIYATLELLPLPPSNLTMEPPTTSEDMWLAILNESTANDTAICSF